MPKKTLTTFVPIEERDPATVRAVILARKSKRGDVSDVQSQVEESQKFIERMGWKLVADPYAYTELGKSGRYDVVRKVLESVVLLAERHEVDVIVAREFERLSRRSEKRTFYIEYCKRYGVEWRFANLAPDGKLPETLEGKIVSTVVEYYGEIEAERIAERMRPGRERRYAAGLPAGGRAGPPYGFQWRPKGPEEKTYSAFIEDSDQAPIVREIFTRLATDEHASARGLARELEQRGVPTATGSRWTGTTIIEMVRNPIYCGRGRRKRWQLAMEPKTDGNTGRKHDYPVVYDRMREPDYEEQTYPLAEGAVPLLVEPAVWEAAQRAIARNRVFGGKTERANSPHPKDATLLHGGFVRCARCGGMMTRHWRTTSKVPMPLYTCTAQVSTPSHFCSRHGINAKVTDQIVLQTLTKVLTDPKQLLDLADKADQQAAEAAAEADRAETTLDVYREQVAKLESERGKCLAAIESLSAMSGDTYRSMIAQLRAELARIDQELTKAKEERKHSIPQLERVRRRKLMLERLQKWGRDYRLTTRSGELVMTENTTGSKRILTEHLDLKDAAEFFGMSEADLRATGIYVGSTWSASDDPDHPDGGELVEVVPTEHMVHLFLHSAPHDVLRQLLRDLNVRVLIKPPRTKEERALHGLTPHKERIVVQFLVDPDEGTQLRPTDTKAWAFLQQAPQSAPR